MSLDVQPGDWVVLASDGLPAVINEEEELAGIIQDSKDPVHVCNELVTRTLDGGAPDNVTVLCIYYEGQESEANVQSGVAQKESNSVHAQ
jgi:protein phosphatase